MLYKLTATEDKGMPKPKYVTDMGGYNDLPTPWRETTVDEWIHSNIYSPSCVEHRQVTGLPGTTYMHNVTIHYFHSHAIAVVWPGDWKCGDKAKGDYFIKYKKPVRYFRIGCDHEWLELSVEECRKEKIYHGGRCYHVNKCGKCGMIESSDSSD